MSYSSLTTYLDCGWRYYLTKVEERRERHSLWLTAGSAIHLALQNWDTRPGEVEDIWEESWKEIYDDDVKNNGPEEDWDYKSREDKKWWLEEGLAMMDRWIEFRNRGWNIYKNYIEKEFEVEVGSSTVKMAIDRVMVDPDGKIVLLDIKTGASSQKHPLQLAVYAWALKKHDGLDVDKAGFWDARTGVLSLWDLDYLHAENVEDVFSMFDIARSSGVFIPNFNSCGRCGVVRYCKWINGKDANNG